MIPGLFPLFLCALTFVEQEIPGLEVERTNPITGDVQANALSADLDRDGQRDIVLPDRVLLNRGGEFPSALSVALPRENSENLYEVFGGSLYARHSSGLTRYQLDGVSWGEVDSFTGEWPDMLSESEQQSMNDDRTNDASWAHNLVDLDGDEVPEVVFLEHEGVRVYSLRERAYTYAATLSIYPEPAIVPLRAAALWPPRARRVIYPPTRHSFRLAFQSGLVNVTEMLGLSSTRPHHRITSYALRRTPDGVTTDMLSVQTSVPSLPFIQAARLNRDDILDLAGTRSYFADNPMEPEQIQELHLSTDSGTTMQIFRSKSFTPFAALLDFDGDGDLDAVTEHAGFFDGDVREFLARGLSGKRISHTLRIHLQDANGAFSRRAQVEHRFWITLDAPPLRDGVMFQKYRIGNLVIPTGDIDGDGSPDLLARTAPDELSVYINRGTGYNAKPDHRIPIARTHSAIVCDVEGDGRADIVLTPTAEGKTRGATSRVYFSRESAAP